MSGDPRFLIPMEDLRVVATVIPRMRRRNLRRMRSINGLEIAFRIDRLTSNPHAECHHERGICRPRERAGESLYPQAAQEARAS